MKYVDKSELGVQLANVLQRFGVDDAMDIPAPFLADMLVSHLDAFDACLCAHDRWVADDQDDDDDREELRRGGYFDVDEARAFAQRRKDWRRQAATEGDEFTPVCCVRFPVTNEELAEELKEMRKLELMCCVQMLLSTASCAKLNEVISILIPHPSR